MTTTARPDTLVTTASQAPEDYDEDADEEPAIDGQVSDNQKAVESRRREKIARFIDDSNEPSYAASLEFLCDKFDEYKKRAVIANSRDWPLLPAMRQ